MFVYAILLLVPAFAFAQNAAHLEDVLFKALDKDGNNEVSKAEAETYFLTYDTNGDKEISNAEFTSGVDKLDAEFQGHETALYKLFDRNFDTHVNQADVDSVFNLADGNRDGKITHPEFVTVFNLVFAMVVG